MELFLYYNIKNKKSVQTALNLLTSIDEVTCILYVCNNFLNTKILHSRFITVRVALHRLRKKCIPVPFPNELYFMILGNVLFWFTLQILKRKFNMKT